MGPVAVGRSLEQRARLAHKSRLLHGKSCGTDGRGVCAESFALYHIWRGESEVARDLLAYRDARIEALQIDDPAGRLPWTQELARRIRQHLAEGDEPPDPSQWASILKAKKQRTWSRAGTDRGPAFSRRQAMPTWHRNRQV
jgi:hypothetical protein